MVLCHTIALEAFLSVGRSGAHSRLCLVFTVLEPDFHASPPSLTKSIDHIDMYRYILIGIYDGALKVSKFDSKVAVRCFCWCFTGRGSGGTAQNVAVMVSSHLSHMVALFLLLEKNRSVKCSVSSFVVENIF